MSRTCTRAVPRTALASAVCAFVGASTLACRSAPPAPSAGSSPTALSVDASLPSAASAPARAPGPPRNDLEWAVASFPSGEVDEARGPLDLRKQLGKILGQVASSAGPNDDIAFVLDQGQWRLEPAFEAAMAAHRSQWPAGRRYALVSVVLGKDGAWTARTVVPLQPDPYELQRAARHLGESGLGRGIWATWSGLAEASRLAWRPGGRPQIVLMTDDRMRGDIGPVSPENVAQWGAMPDAAPPASGREAVIGWAQGMGAALHAVRCLFERNDGRGDPLEPEKQPFDPGQDIRLLPSFFRQGAYVSASTSEALVAAIGAAMESAGGPGDADVALLVDRAGGAGAAFSAIAKASGALDAFVAAPGHRLALVSWRDGPATTAVPFTRQRGAVPGALRAMRATDLGGVAEDIYQPLDVARRLPWNPAARKLLIVVTAATWVTGLHDKEIADWTDDAGVAVTVIDPSDRPPRNPEP